LSEFGHLSGLCMREMVVRELPKEPDIARGKPSKAGLALELRGKQAFLADLEPKEGCIAV